MHCVLIYFLAFVCYMSFLSSCMTIFESFLNYFSQLQQKRRGFPIVARVQWLLGRGRRIAIEGDRCPSYRSKNCWVPKRKCWADHECSSSEGALLLLSSAHCFMMKHHIVCYFTCLVLYNDVGWGICSCFGSKQRTTSTDRCWSCEFSRCVEKLCLFIHLFTCSCTLSFLFTVSV